MKKLVVSAIFASFFLAGCSTTSHSQTELSQLRESLQNEISAVKQQADNAYQTAQQANLNAQDAKALAVKTDEKLNRVFRKSQMK